MPRKKKSLDAMAKSIKSLITPEMKAQMDEWVGDPRTLMRDIIRERYPRTRLSPELKVAIGKHLVEAKRHCRHGEWLPWLKANYDWTPRLAQYYMSLYWRAVEYGVIKHEPMKPLDEPEDG
jgi:hypothetical protein